MIFTLDGYFEFCDKRLKFETIAMRLPCINECIARLSNMKPKKKKKKPLNLVNFVT